MQNGLIKAITELHVLEHEIATEPIKGKSRIGIGGL